MSLPPSSTSIHDAVVTPSRPQTRKTWAFLRSHTVGLVVLTLVAAGLRLSFLDRPALWFDEASTFSRVCGTYDQLLERLRDDGFAPLHYELYWVMHRWTQMTPHMMRIVPAVAGVLMVPVLYFLAVQMTSRRVAMVVALLGATSAYLSIYSRDAKMYMHMWMFATLSTACLLWWLRGLQQQTGWPRVRWACWVLTGAIATGLHLPAMVVLPVQLAMVLTIGRRWGWKLLGAILGFALICAGPVIYYTQFNQYHERIDRTWFRSGLQWVEPYNRGRDAPALLLFTSSAYLMSWEWPQADQQADIAPRTLITMKAAVWTFGILLGLGMIPWHSITRPFRAPRRPAQPPWRNPEPEAEPPGTFRQFADARTGPVPPWKTTLWLAVWLILPAYAFYCASVRNFWSPVDWVTSALLVDPPSARLPAFPRKEETFESFRTATTQALAQTREGFRAENVRWWLVAVLAVVGLASFHFSADRFRARLARVSAMLMVGLVIWLACLGIYLYFEKRMPGSIWMPRYLGAVWPAFIVVVAILLLRLPTGVLRWGAISALVAFNLAQWSGRVFAGTEPPADRIARDLVDDFNSDHTLTFTRIAVPDQFSPGMCALYNIPSRYYLCLYSGRTTTPREIRTFRSNPIDRQFIRRAYERLWHGRFPEHIRREADKSVAGRVVVWEAISRGDNPGNELVEAMNPAWELASQEIFRARDHWTWRDLYSLRRSEFSRREPPTSQPEPSPASRPATVPATSPDTPIPTQPVGR
jgi:4-amino-4-deoxy-L-arabinose transferase-like glycosyltransferase